MPRTSRNDELDQAGEATDQPATPAEPEGKPPELPTEPVTTAAELGHKMVVIHGAAGIGKTTLASQWNDGDVFFLNTAGELGDLLVRQVPVLGWKDFRTWAWGIAEAGERPGTVVIDTGDMLGKYCAEQVRRVLGIAHESDLDWGKGWSTLRDTFQTNVAKLAAIPNMGVVFVVHSDAKEVKTRSGTYDKWQFRGVKGIRETLLDMSDLVLFLDHERNDDDETIESDELRVMRTKPSRYWDAKERGEHPRLPPAITWPFGKNGWEILQAAWEEGGQK
jgi:hypothetical protein